MMSTAYISAVNTITGTVNDQICTHVLTYLNPNTHENIMKFPTFGSVTLECINH